MLLESGGRGVGKGKAAVVEEKQPGRRREGVVSLPLGADDNLCSRGFGAGGAMKGECVGVCG